MLARQGGLFYLKGALMLESAKRGKCRAGKNGLIKHLTGKYLTRKQAIRAKCYDCDGMGETGKCDIGTCSLYPFSPYSPLRKRRLQQKTLVIGVFLCLFLIIPTIACAEPPSTKLTASYYTVKSCIKESGQSTMANGKELQDDKLTAASWDYPFEAILRVTNLTNSRAVIVKVTDRGPAKKLYAKGRALDLSYAAMCKLDGVKQGIISVKVERLK